MEKVNIAKELLNNSSNVDINKLISDYILNIGKLEQGKCGDEQLMRLHQCISYIKKDNFDITGWMLSEIPIYFIHSFLNKHTNNAFELTALDDGEVIPQYLDNQENLKNAKTIKEAIEKYIELELFESDNLIAEDDDISLKIKSYNGEQYLERILASINNEEGNPIGDMTGYVLNTENILTNKNDSFLVMDGISQLLCNVHSYIVQNKKVFYDKQSVLYLNRLSLYKEYYNNELEENVLETLLDSFKTVIYSLGSTELTDKDFFEHQDDFYFKYWEKQLKRKGWKYNSNLDLYYKTIL